MRLALVFIAIFVMTVSSVAVPVMAWDTYQQGPLERDYLMTLNADANASYTKTFNYSDPHNQYLMNWNQTIMPFMNASGINGVFTGSWLPPSLINVRNSSATVVHLMGTTRFKSTQTMSGSSYSWWRVPLENPWSNSLTLRIWHLDNPEFLNWSGEGGSYPNPVEISHPLLVYNWTYDLKSNAGLNRSFYWFNQTTDWIANFTHHFAWLKVVAPFHSDEAYAYEYIIGGVPTAVRIYYSLNDIGDDSLWRSWWYATGNTTSRVDADLDCSVIHEYGMGDSVSGFRVIPGFDVSTLPSIPGPDGISEALSPSGTDLDGDWSASYGSLLMDSSITKVGSNSIIWTIPDTTVSTFGYQFDSDKDVSHYTSLRFWLRTSNVLVSGGDYISLYDINPYSIYWRLYDAGCTQPSTWYFCDLDIHSAVGFGTSGFDVHHVAGIVFGNYLNGRTGYTVRLDDVHFGVNQSSINFYAQFPRAVVNGEYVTFMMPFIKDVSNASDARVTISNVNGSWTSSYWVARDGPTDFTIRSLNWSESYGNSLFFINVSFLNRSNSLFIWDPNTDFPMFFTDDSPYSTHCFKVFDNPNYTYGESIYFRPYYALQITPGFWTNTHLDPVYILDGHVISISILQNLDASVYYPWYIQVLDGLEVWAAWVYNGVMNWDFPLLHALFPSLDPFKVRDIVDGVGRALKFVGSILYQIGAFIVQAGKWFADNASYIFAEMFHIINLIIFIPVFFALVLTTNGIKRYFVILARDGPLAAGEYAERFWANSIKMWSSLPISRAIDKAGGAMKEVV